MSAVISNLLLIGLALVALFVPSPFGQRRDAPPPLETSSAQQMRAPARFVARDSVGIGTSRLANVLEVSVAVGDRVAAGQFLLVLRDLAIVRKRAAANEELRRLEAATAKAEARSSAVRQAESRVRSEAARRMEADYRAVLKDFERLQELFDEGLLARVEYERHKKDMESRRLEAKAARESIDRSSVPDVREEIKSLASARRSLERLESLSDTFVLRTPWDAVVEEIAVAPGDTPDRGSVLMLLVEIER